MSTGTRRPVQAMLPLPDPPCRGGARERAGRKPAGARAGVSHHGRPSVPGPLPAHVTVRVLPRVWNLRSERALRIVERALEGAKAWQTFRVVHFSMMGAHLHLIVEADDGRALSEGMQGLSVRLAKGLNRLMGTRGKVLADRFHAHVLHTPAEARNALAYVLLNHRSHLARAGRELGRATLDLVRCHVRRVGGDREPAASSTDRHISASHVAAREGVARPRAHLSSRVASRRAAAARQIPPREEAREAPFRLNGHRSSIVNPACRSRRAPLRRRPADRPLGSAQCFAPSGANASTRGERRM